MVVFFIALRILQAEKLTDDELLAFGLCGGKKYKKKEAIHTEDNSGLDWVLSDMWSELYFLSTIKPFSRESLGEHIGKYPKLWDKINTVDFISYEDLPSKDLIDLSQFKLIELHDAIAMSDPLSDVTGENYKKLREAIGLTKANNAESLASDTSVKSRDEQNEKE